jgi:hypothetical protein
MIVDCMTCPVRGGRCEDCAVTALSAPRMADHLASAGVRLPAEVRSVAAPQPDSEPWWTPEQWTPGLRRACELQLDAAEHEAVSRFVGAGLVSADVVGGLRARRESVQQLRSVRNVS